MAENYKQLYEQMKKLVALYQDEVVPELREQLASRVEVVRCKDCKHRENIWGEFCCPYIEDLPVGDDFFCGNGERKDNE